MKFSGCLLTHSHTDSKYPDQDCEKLQLPIQIQLSEKRKRFSNFLLHFWILHKILNILKQRMIVIAIVFRKLQTVTNFVRTLSKKCPFRRSFDSNHVKESEILPKSPWECFYHVFSSFPLKLILKMSPLLLGEILSVSVNKLTADAKYPIQDCENLLLPIQIQLSEKPKAFPKLFVPFLESTSNFKHFGEEDDCQS